MLMNMLLKKNSIHRQHVADAFVFNTLIEVREQAEQSQGLPHSNIISSNNSVL
jgi:hypothetical protein